MAADVRLPRNEGHQVGGRDTKLFRRGDEAIHLFRQRRRDPDRPAALVLRRTDHDGPATTAALEDALTSENEIGLQRRVAVDAQVRGEVSRRREAASRRELAGVHKQPELIDKLLVDRGGVFHREAQVEESLDRWLDARGTLRRRRPRSRRPGPHAPSRFLARGHRLTTFSRIQIVRPEDVLSRLPKAIVCQPRSIP